MSKEGTNVDIPENLWCAALVDQNSVADDESTSQSTNVDPV